MKVSLQTHVVMHVTKIKHLFHLFEVQPKDSRQDNCSIIERIELDPNFFITTIFRDESWIFEDDPKTPNLEWNTANSPRSEKAKIKEIKNQVHAYWLYGQYKNHPQTTKNLFFRDNNKSTFLPGGSSKAQEMCCSCEAKNQTEMDVAPRQCALSYALSITEFFATKSIPVVSQLPYSLDSPCDFFPFPCLKGSQFGPLSNIQKTVTDFPKEHSGFRVSTLL